MGVLSKFHPPLALTRLIADQAGVFTTAQAEAHGATRNVVDRFRTEGRWVSIARGLWSVSPDPPWLGLAWGGLLLGGDGAALGAGAAMHLWGAGNQPEVIPVWSASAAAGRRGPWLFRAGTRPGRGTPTRVGMEDATLETCSGANSLDDVMGALGRALSTRGTTVERLAARAAELPSLRNRRHIMAMLEQCRGGVESPLERRYLLDVERAHGLPVGRRQMSLRVGSRVDVCYEEFGLVVELDGRLWHEGLAAHADMGRDNLNLLDGLRTLRYGWPPVGGHPCRVAGQVGRGLSLGGWDGRLRTCRRC